MWTFFTLSLIVHWPPPPPAFMLRGSQVHSTLQSFLSSFFSPFSPVGRRRSENGLLRTQNSKITQQRLSSADPTKRLKIHQIQRIRVVRTRMLSLLQRMLRKLNHIMTTFNRQEDLQHLQSTLLQTTDAFSLYARHWHVYKRCHVTLTLNVYEEIFNPQSWADVYTPLTQLSTVEYLKEIYCQFKHNLVKRDLICKVVHDIILPMEFIRKGLLHFYNQ